MSSTSNVVPSGGTTLDVYAHVVMSCGKTMLLLVQRFWLLQPSPTASTSLRSRGMRHLHPHVRARQCRVVKRLEHEHVPRDFGSFDEGTDGVMLHRRRRSRWLLHQTTSSSLSAPNPSCTRGSCSQTVPSALSTLDASAVRFMQCAADWRWTLENHGSYTAKSGQEPHPLGKTICSSGLCSRLAASLRGRLSLCL